MKELLKNIWILVCVFLFFMGISAESMHYLQATRGIMPTAFETFLLTSNETHFILFPLMYILLLISMGGGIGEIQDKLTPYKLLKNAILISIAYVVLFIFANTFYALLTTDIKYVFSNTWSYSSELSSIGLSPLLICIISILLILMRNIFCVYTVSLINTLTRKRHWGFWILFLITYIDFSFYRMLHIRYPLGILPIEHTRITYTEALLPSTYEYSRFPYFISFIYWILLIGIVLIIFILISNRRRKHS